MCVVDAASGELTLEGVGECVVTAATAGPARYSEATSTFSITVLEAGSLALTANDIAGDDTVNIAEKAEGFSISGDTGSEAGVTVTVTVGSEELTATPDADGAWSVNVPAGATYIVEPSVPVTVSASKTGIASATVVRRTLAVDLTPPFVSFAPVPDTLKVGVRVDIDMKQSTSTVDIISARATGLPSGLRISNIVKLNRFGIIFGTLVVTNVNMAHATVTVTDRAGNSTGAPITFPAVAKGDQTLTGFAYNASPVALGSAAPTVTAPTRTVTHPTVLANLLPTLSYSTTSSDMCTVEMSTGALKLLAVGRCEVTATAAGTPNYNSATATFTVIVQAAGTLVLDLDAIADDNTVSIREKAAGFTISGNTGTVPDVLVKVMVGTAKLNATSGADGAWSVNVPANAAYITESSVTVVVSASKAGLTPPSDVMRTLPVDLTVPSVSYPEPDVIQEAGVVVEITPSTSATDIAEYRWLDGRFTTGLFRTSSLHLDTTTGVIRGVLELPFDCGPYLGNCIRVEDILVIDRAGNSHEVRASLTTANLGSGVTLHVDDIAEDNTVNIAEKAAGFTISGNTASEVGGTVTVTVTVDTTELTATPAANGAWSVDVPPDDAYITEPSVIVTVTVTVSAGTTRFRSSSTAVNRALTVDLTGPTAPTYAAPATLTMGVAIAAMDPSGGSDIAMYSATGLPPGLSIDAGTGVITGTPDTLNTSAATATVTVTDSAGNPAAVSIAFPAVTELVTVSVAPASATEGEPVEFTVTLSGVVGWDVFLGWRAADGTATLGVDFDAAVDDFFGAAGYLTVNAGTTSATFTVATLEDILAESDETFTVTLVDVLGFREGVSLSPGMASATGTITDDDPLVAGVSVAETVVEGDTVEFSVTIGRIGSFRAISSAPVVFTYTLGGTATAGDDYTAPDPPATLTVAAGDRFGRISIPTVGDSVLDPGETLTVTLSSATTTAGTVSVYPTSVTATTTIMDPGTETVSVAAAAPRVPEGEAAEFTVTLSGAVGTDVALDWSTAGDTATEGADYTAVSGGTVTFVPGGSLTQTISVTTLQDTLAESNETFTVTLAAPGTGLPTGVSLSTATATVTIEDDDAIEASVAADAETVVEGDAAQFTVTLTGATSTAPVVVGYTVSGTATPGDDYTGPGTPATLTLDTGAKTGTLSIQTTSDSLLDPGETLTVTLNSAMTAGTAEYSRTAATTTIADSGKVMVSVEAAAPTVTEGDDVEFTVTLSGAVASDVAVDWSTADGTAIAGVDYGSGAFGALAVTAGTTSATFTVTTLDDTLAELDETFTVTLAAPGAGLPEGVSLGAAAATATVTIKDDDSIMASVTADAETVNEGEAAQFTVTLSGATSTAPVVVTYTLGGTATADEDYTAPDEPRELTITAGATSTTLSIRTTSDSVLDRGETLIVTLTGARTAGTVTVDSTVAKTTITDSGTAMVSVADARATEGDDVEFTVTLSMAAGSDTVLGWTTDPATSDDYTAVTAGTLTISAGDTTGTLTVSTAEDLLAEADETFTVTITGTTLPSGVTLGTATAAGTIEDDDTLTAAVTADAETVNEGDAAQLHRHPDRSHQHCARGGDVHGGRHGDAGDDYTAPDEPRELTITAGATSTTLTIRTTSDSVLDRGETLIDRRHEHGGRDPDRGEHRGGDRHRGLHRGDDHDHRRRHGDGVGGRRERRRRATTSSSW